MDERNNFMCWLSISTFCVRRILENMWRCFIGFSIILNLKGVKKKSIVGIASIGNNYNGCILLWLRFKDSDYHLSSPLRVSLSRKQWR